MEMQIIQKNDKMDIFLQILTIIIAIFSTYFVLTTSESKLNTSTWIIFGIIIGSTILIFIFLFLYEEYKNVKKEIGTNKESIQNIENILNFKELFSKMDIRVTVLEKLFKMKKKGNSSIDPRIIMVIILLILFFLFLKSIGKI